MKIEKKASVDTIIQQRNENKQQSRLEESHQSKDHSYMSHTLVKPAMLLSRAKILGRKRLELKKVMKQ